MKKMLELLIVEDSKSHLEDAKAEIQKRINTGLSIKADYSSTYVDVKDKISKRYYDGIISDIFFPFNDEKSKHGEPNGWDHTIAVLCYDLLKDHGVNYKEDTHPSALESERKIVQAADEWYGERRSMHPTGVIVVDESKKRGIPIVLCTDTYHHGDKTQPAYSYCRQNDVDMVDVSLDQTKLSSTAKDWDKAYQRLLYRVVKKILKIDPLNLDSYSKIEAFNKKFNKTIQPYRLPHDELLKDRPIGESLKKELESYK